MDDVLRILQFLLFSRLHENEITARETTILSIDVFLRYERNDRFSWGTTSRHGRPTGSNTLGKRPIFPELLRPTKQFLCVPEPRFIRTRISFTDRLHRVQYIQYVQPDLFQNRVFILNCIRMQFNIYSHVYNRLVSKLIHPSHGFCRSYGHASKPPPRSIDKIGEWWPFAIIATPNTFVCDQIPRGYSGWTVAFTAATAVFTRAHAGIRPPSYVMFEPWIIQNSVYTVFRGTNSASLTLTRTVSFRSL